MTPNNTFIPDPVVPDPFIPDPVVSAAITDATVDPDGLHLYRVKFNDAGEMYGLTQINEAS